MPLNQTITRAKVFVQLKQKLLVEIVKKKKMFD